jgi:lipoprotein NlpD
MKHEYRDSVLKSPIEIGSRLPTLPKKCKKTGWVLVLAASISLLMTGCSDNVYREMPEVVVVKKVVPYHVVEEDDTVGSVANRYGMTRTELIKLNGLHPPYQLYNGQRLVVRPTMDAHDDSPIQDIEPDQSSKDKISRIREPMITIQSDAPKKEDGPMLEESAPRPVENPEAIDTETRETETETETEDDVARESAYQWPIADGRNKVDKHFGDEGTDGGELRLKTSVGTPVRPIADGVVIISGTLKEDAAGYGKTVVVKHADKHIISIYAFMRDISVKVGRRVKKSDIMGTSGQFAKQPQLYLQVMDTSGKEKKSIDPEKLLP